MFRIIFIGMAGISLLAGCKTADLNPGEGDLAPDLSPSTQIQRRFFLCKDFVGGEWIGVGDTFSTLDERIIVVARLDPGSLHSRLTMEIISPEGDIIEVEHRQYTQVRDVGIYFSPAVLIEKGGGAGRYRARFFIDAGFAGEEPFFVEDRDDTVIEALSPDLEGIEWEPETP